MAKVSVVAVAQLVESRIVIPVVVGSSPISHPIFRCCVLLLRGHNRQPVSLADTVLSRTTPTGLVPVFCF